MRALIYILLLMISCVSKNTFESDLTNWLNEVNLKILEEGLELNDEYMAIAKEIGIEKIDAIRYLIIKEVPVPQKGSPLYDEGVKRNLWGEGIIGNAQVFGYGIALTEEVFNDKGKMAHELMHVKQIERFGNLEDFVITYLKQIEEFGYIDAPLEKEAFEWNDKF